MGRTRLARLRWSAALGLALAAGGAFADLKDFGPPDPVHGFPAWYRDTGTLLAGYPDGLPLEPCLSTAASAAGPMCVLLPDPGYDPGQPIVYPTNFPHEMFYTIIDQVFRYTGGEAKVRIALEGAFANEVVATGDQVVFARVRVVIDAPVAGTYTITHPYGVETQTADVAGARAIVFTRDIGFAPGIFTGALAGDVGPFLTCGGGPVVIGEEQFIGDPNVPCAAVGSPFGTNYIEIVGPPGANLGGPAGTPNVVTANLLSLSGKIFTRVIRAPLQGVRATYGRDASNAYLDVFAVADPLANTGDVGSSLRVTGAGIPTTGMPSDPAGNFFAHITIPNPPALPAEVTVTNVADVPASSVSIPLVDEVVITLASYDPVARTLTLRATSKDREGPVTLTYGSRTLSGGAVTVSGVAAPPPSVTVTSSKGGSDTKAVTVVPGPVTGVRVAVRPPAAASTVVAYEAAAAGGTGDYEYRFWHRSAAPGSTWTVVQDYSRLATWLWDFAPSPRGPYYVQVDARNAGSTANREAAAVALYNSNAATGVEFASITPASPNPLPRPATITFTAQGVGGSGNYEYQFWVRSAAPGSIWSVAQPYGSPAGATFAWSTGGLTEGPYYVQVDCRAVGSVSARDAAKVTSYTLR